MRTCNGRILALAAVLALLVSVGSLASALPASASGPINQFNYPGVLGVDGSAQSLHAMNLGTMQRFQIVKAKAPWIASSSDTESMALWRYAGSGRDYVGVSGQYCKNKTGGDVFVATGVPVDDGLTC